MAPSTRTRIGSPFAAGFRLSDLGFSLVGSSARGSQRQASQMGLETSLGLALAARSTRLQEQPSAIAHYLTGNMCCATAAWSDSQAGRPKLVDWQQEEASLQQLDPARATCSRKSRFTNYPSSSGKPAGRILARVHPLRRPRNIAPGSSDSSTNQPVAQLSPLDGRSAPPTAGLLLQRAQAELTWAHLGAPEHMHAPLALGAETMAQLQIGPTEICCAHTQAK